MALMPVAADSLSSMQSGSRSSSSSTPLQLRRRHMPDAVTAFSSSAKAISGPQQRRQLPQQRAAPAAASAPSARLLQLTVVPGPLAKGDSLRAAADATPYSKGISGAAAISAAPVAAVVPVSTGASAAVAAVVDNPIASTPPCVVTTAAGTCSPHFTRIFEEDETVAVAPTSGGFLTSPFAAPASTTTMRHPPRSSAAAPAAAVLDVGKPAPAASPTTAGADSLRSLSISAASVSFPSSAASSSRTSSAPERSPVAAVTVSGSRRPPEAAADFQVAGPRRRLLTKQQQVRGLLQQQQQQVCGLQQQQQQQLLKGGAAAKPTVGVAKLAAAEQPGGAAAAATAAAGEQQHEGGAAAAADRAASADGARHSATEGEKPQEQRGEGGGGGAEAAGGGDSSVEKQQQHEQQSGSGEVDICAARYQRSRRCSSSDRLPSLPMSTPCQSFDTTPLRVSPYSSPCAALSSSRSLISVRNSSHYSSSPTSAAAPPPSRFSPSLLPPSVTGDLSAALFVNSRISAPSSGRIHPEASVSAAAASSVSSSSCAVAGPASAGELPAAAAAMSPAAAAPAAARPCPSASAAFADPVAHGPPPASAPAAGWCAPPSTSAAAVGSSDSDTVACSRPPAAHLLLPALLGDPIVCMHLNSKAGIAAGSMLGRVSAFLFDIAAAADKKAQAPPAAAWASSPSCCRSSDNLPQQQQQRSGQHRPRQQEEKNSSSSGDDSDEEAAAKQEDEATAQQTRVEGEIREKKRKEKAEQNELVSAKNETAEQQLQQQMIKGRRGESESATVGRHGRRWKTGTAAAAATITTTASPLVLLGGCCCSCIPVCCSSTRDSVDIRSFSTRELLSSSSWSGDISWKVKQQQQSSSSSSVPRIFLGESLQEQGCCRHCCYPCTCRQVRLNIAAAVFRMIQPRAIVISPPLHPYCFPQPAAAAAGKKKHRKAAVLNRERRRSSSRSSSASNTVRSKDGLWRGPAADVGSRCNSLLPSFSSAAADAVAGDVVDAAATTAAATTAAATAAAAEAGEASSVPGANAAVALAAAAPAAALLLPTQQQQQKTGATPAAAAVASAAEAAVAEEGRQGGEANKEARQGEGEGGSIYYRGQRSEEKKEREYYRETGTDLEREKQSGSKKDGEYERRGRSKGGKPAKFTAAAAAVVFAACIGLQQIKRGISSGCCFLRRQLLPPGSSAAAAAAKHRSSSSKKRRKQRTEKGPKSGSLDIMRSSIISSSINSSSSKRMWGEKKEGMLQRGRGKDSGSGGRRSCRTDSSSSREKNNQTNNKSSSSSRRDTQVVWRFFKKIENCLDCDMSQQQRPYPCSVLPGQLVVFAAFGDDQCACVAVGSACVYAIFGMNEVVRWRLSSLKCLGGEHLVPPSLTPHRSAHSSTTFYTSRYPLPIPSHYLCSSFSSSSSSSSFFPLSVSLPHADDEAEGGGRIFVGGGGLGLVLSFGKEAKSCLKRRYCNVLWRSIEANGLVILDFDGAFLLCVTTQPSERQFLIIDLRGACTSSVPEYTPMSSGRKNWLYRHVIYKREAPTYFSLAKLYKQTLLLVCRGCCMHVYDCRLMLQQQVKRRQQQGICSCFEEKKKKQQQRQEEKEEEEKNQKEEEEKRKKHRGEGGEGGSNSSSSKTEETDTENEYADDLCAADPLSLESAAPPAKDSNVLLLPDKSKAVHIFARHASPIIAVETTRKDSFLFSLSGDGELLLWKWKISKPLRSFSCSPATFYLGWPCCLVSDEDIVAFSADQGVFALKLSE